MTDPVRALPELDGFHHVTLTVADLDSSVTWYSKVLGFKEQARASGEGLTKALMVRGDLHFSFVAHGARSVGPLVTSKPTERAHRQHVLQLVEASFDPLPFDAEAARSFGAVAASLRASGRKPPARGYDALIAAVAISQGMPLHTANPDDFAHIEGLDLRPVRRYHTETSTDQP